MTNIKLELITDINMFQFVEKGMHGEISCISNKCMKEYDKAPSKYIMHLDANSLYGYAMANGERY